MQDAASAAERFAAAHAALKADSAIQFSLTPAPAPPQPPLWLRHFLEWLAHALRPVGRFLRWIGSFFPDAMYARIFLWFVLVLAAAFLLWMAYTRLRHGEWRLPRRRMAAAGQVDAEEPDWQPEADPARSWLNEADALAERGLYAEAAHHLLIRSIEDIGRRRPRVVKPALTSREIAGEQAIPRDARKLFTGIAQLVERSLFGGQSVSADEWSAARADYARFALPVVWRA